MGGRSGEEPRDPWFVRMLRFVLLMFLIGSTAMWLFMELSKWEGLEFYYVETRFADGGEQVTYSTNVLIARSGDDLRGKVEGFLKELCREYANNTIKDPTVIYNHLWDRVNSDDSLKLVYYLGFDINIDDPRLVGKKCNDTWSGFFKDFPEGPLNYTGLILEEPGSGKQTLVQVRLTPINWNGALNLLIIAAVLVTGLLVYSISGEAERHSVVDSVVGFIYASIVTLMLVRNSGAQALAHGNSTSKLGFILLLASLLYIMHTNRAKLAAYLNKSFKDTNKLERIRHSLIESGLQLIIAFSVTFLIFVALWYGDLLDYLIPSLQQTEVLLTLTVIGMVLILTLKEHDTLTRMLLYYSTLIVSTLTVNNLIILREIISEGAKLLDNDLLGFFITSSFFLTLFGYMKLLGAYFVKLFEHK